MRIGGRHGVRKTLAGILVLGVLPAFVWLTVTLLPTETATVTYTPTPTETSIATATPTACRSPIGGSMLNTTDKAVQTYYQNGVPHTDKYGNFRTTYDSTSFFPNGVFWISDHSTDASAISDLKTAGFNTAITIRSDSAYYFLDQITDDSFKLVLNNTLFEDQDGYYKNDPRVLGWWIEDEVLSKTLWNHRDPQKTFDILNQFYQSHQSQTSQVMFETENPVIKGYDSWNTFADLGNAVSDYSYARDGMGYFNSWEGTADAVKAIVDAVNQNKPAWFVPQAFEGWPGLIYPYPQEERAQIYTALVHGATGIFHFSWDSCEFRSFNEPYSGIRPNIPNTLPNCPNNTVITDDERDRGQALWDSLDGSKNGINYELETLKPVILSPTSDQQYFVYVDRAPISEAPIRTMLKYYEGSYYLIAVNMDNATIKGEIVLPFIIKNADIMFENKKPSFYAGNDIVDTFAPFDVNVYRITSAP
jgi:hypothetical protein